MTEDELSWMFIGGLSRRPPAERDGLFELFSWAVYDHIVRRTKPALETLIWLYEEPPQGHA